MTDRPPTEIDRHHRQMLLPGWGEAGQAKLREATAVVVGVGALGCVSSELLCRAGVGRLRVIDRDVVEPTNLQRQMLYGESDIGRPKAEAAADRLRQIDSSLTIEPTVAHLHAEGIGDLVRGADVMVDGTDNFETRYLINDTSVAFGIPMIYGGAVARRGTVMPVVPDRGPCLRCIEEHAPPASETCDTVGVLGPAVAWVGARQAALTLRLILEGPAALPLRLEYADLWSGESRSIDVSAARDPACPCCGARRFEYLEGLHETDAKSLCGRNSVQILAGDRREVALAEVAERLHHHGKFRIEDGLLSGHLDHEPGLGLTLFRDGRAIVHGTSDQDRARAVYDRYVGG